MGLDDLQRSAAEAEAYARFRRAGSSPDDEGYETPFFDMQELVTWLLPSEPNDAVLYYNPEVLRSKVCLDRARAAFRARHPGIKPREYPLSPDKLKYFSICRHPLAEQVFRQRGYVSNIEFQNQRGRQFESQYVKQSKAAVHLQLMVIDMALTAYARHEPNGLKFNRRASLEAFTGQRPKKLTAKDKKVKRTQDKTKNTAAVIMARI